MSRNVRKCKNAKKLPSLGNVKFQTIPDKIWTAVYSLHFGSCQTFVSNKQYIALNWYWLRHKCGWRYSGLQTFGNFKHKKNLIE